MVWCPSIARMQPPLLSGRCSLLSFFFSKTRRRSRSKLDYRKDRRDWQVRRERKRRHCELSDDPTTIDLAVDDFFSDAFQNEQEEPPPKKQRLIDDELVTVTQLQHQLEELQHIVQTRDRDLRVLEIERNLLKLEIARLEHELRQTRHSSAARIFQLERAVEERTWAAWSMWANQMRSSHGTASPAPRAFCQPSTKWRPMDELKRTRFEERWNILMKDIELLLERHQCAPDTFYAMIARNFDSINVPERKFDVQVASEDQRNAKKHNTTAVLEAALRLARDGVKQLAAAYEEVRCCFFVSKMRASVANSSPERGGRIICRVYYVIQHQKKYKTKQKTKTK